MTVGLLSNITGFLPVFVTGQEPKNVFDARNIEVLTADQTVGVRDFVNKLAGSQRLYAHGLLYPGTANLFEIQRQIDHNKPDAWKGYCVSLAAKQLTDPAGASMKQWRLDDEQVMYPTFELIRKYQVILRPERPAFGNICVHKGFAPPPHDAAHDNPENGNPEDLPKVARDWPTFNFIIYHSCIRPVLFYNPKPLANLLSAHPVLREGVPDIEWTTRFAQVSRSLHNVYAEVGSTFASTIITFPSVWAHIIGQLLQNMGSHRVVFGSDSLWYGSPQWQYEAFWRFQIPEPLQKKWNYPEIKDADKRRIIGLNSAHLYHISSKKPKKSCHAVYVSGSVRVGQRLEITAAKAHTAPPATASTLPRRLVRFHGATISVSPAKASVTASHCAPRIRSWRMKCANTIAWTRQQKIAEKRPASRWTRGSTAPPRRNPSANAVPRNSRFQAASPV